MSLFSLHGIHKEYALGRTRVKALNAVDLEIGASEFTVIAGASGSGKTTLLNLIGLIDEPSSGNIAYQGKTLSGNSTSLSQIRRDDIGYIFQTFNLIPVMNVYENVEYALILQNIPKKQRQARVMETLDQVGLANRYKHKPRELSGGQRQRVAIARALVKQPRLVLADEPTANLDSVTGGDILDLMQQLHAQGDTTFLFSSHDPMVVGRARRIVRLKDGQIVNEEAAA